MLIAGRAVEGVGLGTAQFAFRDGSLQDSVATVHAAVDAGVALIDTALAYTRIGVESYAEHVIALALRGATGEHPLIATKGGHWRDGVAYLAYSPFGGPAGRPLAGASRPASIRDSAALLDLTDEDLADLRAV